LDLSPDFPEARYLLGSDTITHNGNGAQTFTLSFPYTQGNAVTLSATDSNGSTSEFGILVTLPQPPRRSSGGGSRLTPAQLDNLGITITEQPGAPSAPSTENPFGGNLCPAHLIITNNMKQGDRDGRMSTYNRGIVTQIHILQGHMNRLLLDEYGQQASGPVDGIFGPLTKRGVERLQRRLNQLLEGKITPLVIDGIVGPFTRAAINMSC
ncbi:MAG: peptidoglycan-binding protein, partial [Candidatus Pacebacteria bacterium]|nr:peptidoglycan-binding protein [Candidatus Paceibacterota bacterium]